MSRQNVKGLVHAKMTILSSFTHPHAILNLYVFLSSAEHKKLFYIFRRMVVLNECSFHRMFFRILKKVHKKLYFEEWNPKNS